MLAVFLKMVKFPVRRRAGDKLLHSSHDQEREAHQVLCTGKGDNCSLVVAFPCNITEQTPLE